jgi:hypothetical protein
MNSTKKVDEETEEDGMNGTRKGQQKEVLCS